MASPPTSQTADLQALRDSRADDRADIARVLVALGLLALLASFDGEGHGSAAAETPTAQVSGAPR